MDPSIGRHVLVVEDDEDVREAEATLLRDHGHVVLEATNGQEALDHLRTSSEKPCLVLLDLMMPIMSGWELLDALDAEPDLRDIPVVVVTAVTTGMLPRRTGTPILPKPIKVERLLDIVDAHCAAASPSDASSS